MGSEITELKDLVHGLYKKMDALEDKINKQQGKSI